MRSTRSAWGTASCTRRLRFFRLCGALPSGAVSVPFDIRWRLISSDDPNPYPSTLTLNTKRSTLNPNPYTLHPHPEHRCLDPATSAKVTFISGDTSVGTDNDRMLQSILGENWRELTGQDKPVMEEGGSRGYSHAAAWAAAVREESVWLRSCGVSQVGVDGDGGGVQYSR